MTALGTYLAAGIAQRHRALLASATDPILWDEDQMVLGTPNLSIYLDDALDLWMVYVDQVGKRVVLSADTYNTLSTHQPAINAFVRDILGQGIGVLTLDTRTEVFTEAARKAAAEYGLGISADRVSLLVERLHILIGQAAATHRGEVDAVTMQTFTFRYGQARTQLAALEAELTQAHALLELAGTAIVEL